MSSINWGLLTAPDIGGAFQAGMGRGREMKRQQALQGALSAFAADPSDPANVSALTAIDPVLGLRVQSEQTDRARITNQQADAAEKKSRANLQDLARLLDDAKDESGYQRGLRVAQSLGIDTAGAPATFDPEWVNDQKFMVQSLMADQPKTTSFLQEAAALGVSGDELKTLWKDRYAPPMQAIDVTNADGSVNRYFYPKNGMPNQPGQGGGTIPPPQAIEMLRGNPGLKAQFEQKYGAGAADRALGGASSTSSRTFQP